MKGSNISLFVVLVFVFLGSSLVGGDTNFDVPLQTQYHPSHQDLSPDGLRWVTTTQLGKTISGSRPSPRIWHCAGLYTRNVTNEETNTTITRNKMLVLGGWDMQDKMFNDLYEFDIDYFNWTQIEADDVSVPDGVERPIQNRLAATAITPDHKYFILFGGSSMVSVILPYVHIYDIDNRQWLPPVSSGVLPPARAAHTMVYSEFLDGYLIYGGGTNISLKDTNPSLQNDLWLYKWRDQVWTQLAIGDPLAPLRFAHSSACNNNGTKMYVYGGSKKGALDYSGLEPDVYVYDIIANSWALLNSTSPRTLAGQYLFYFQLTNSLVMIPYLIAKNNIDFTGLVSNTTFRYSLETNHWLTVYTSGPVSEYLAWFSCVITPSNLMVLFAGITASLQANNDMYFIQLGNPSDYEKYAYRIPAASSSADEGNSVDPKTLAGALVPSLLILLCIIAGAAFFLVRHRRNARRMELLTMMDVGYNQADYYLLADRNQIKDIEIKERLGGGNFGEVFKGVWQGTTAVACKSLKSEDQMGDFLREAATLKSLTHPNVVQFLGIFISNGGEKFMVTEYLSLGSLNQLLIQQQKKLQPIDLLGMCKHVSAGMRYISEQKQLVHRDLALRNLLVTLQENKYLVKIADLGLTRRVGDDGKFISKDTHIPVKWTAPEAIQNGEYSAKSDVWSMGIVMWELFSYGSTPYPTMANSEVLPRILEGYRMAAPVNMPEEVSLLMARCWNIDPQQRPTFKNLHEEIDQILQKLFLSLSPEAALSVTTNINVASADTGSHYESHTNVFYSAADNESNYQSGRPNAQSSSHYAVGGGQQQSGSFYSNNNNSVYATPNVTAQSSQKDNNYYN